jgi:hypothetical protein
VDFDFIYQEVGSRYDINGNVSVAPPTIIKMMLLLILYNVRPERLLTVDKGRLILFCFVTIEGLRPICLLLKKHREDQVGREEVKYVTR